jgi:hypothetical protein
LVGAVGEIRINNQLRIVVASRRRWVLQKRASVKEFYSTTALANTMWTRMSGDPIRKIDVGLELHHGGHQVQRQSFSSNKQ